MKQVIYLLVVFFCVYNLQANDSAYFTSGNHLIPISESDIHVQKEILSINRKSESEIEVMVYYEFYNPNKSKKITVGFEAMSPSGDAQVTPKDGRHPYISEFTVEVNSSILPYKVAMVDDSLYYKNGQIKGLESKQIADKSYDGWAEYSYVYYFDAVFNQGLNIVKHTYTFDLSGGVMYNYNFDYVLSAAARWGNKQIDDFTLIVNMGEFQDFYIRKTFFDNIKDWNIVGIGKAMNKSIDWLEGTELEESVLHFYMMKGSLVFRKQNFVPKDELFLISPRFMQIIDYDHFDYRRQLQLPLTTELYFESTADDLSKKILRNLPFAKRGYVFSNPELKKYYTNQFWYIPNPSYKSNMDDLAPKEQEWVLRWSE